MIPGFRESNQHFDSTNTKVESSLLIGNIEVMGHIRETWAANSIFNSLHSPMQTAILKWSSVDGGIAAHGNAWTSWNYFLLYFFSDDTRLINSDT